MKMQFILPLVMFRYSNCTCDDHNFKLTELELCNCLFFKSHDWVKIGMQPPDLEELTTLNYLEHISHFLNWTSFDI